MPSYFGLNKGFDHSSPSEHEFRQAIAALQSLVAERTEDAMHAHDKAAEAKNTADNYARTVNALNTRIADVTKQREMLKQEVDEFAQQRDEIALICKTQRKELELLKGYGAHPPLNAYAHADVLMTYAAAGTHYHQALETKIRFESMHKQHHSDQEEICSLRNWVADLERAVTTLEDDKKKLKNSVAALDKRAASYECGRSDERKAIREFMGSEVKERNRKHSPERPHDQTWTQKNGKVVLITKMSNRHLRNTIAMLDRAGQCWTTTYHNLVAEQKYRTMRGFDDGNDTN